MSSYTSNRINIILTAENVKPQGSGKCEASWIRNGQRYHMLSVSELWKPTKQLCSSQRNIMIGLKQRLTVTVHGSTHFGEREASVSHNRHYNIRVFLHLIHIYPRLAWFLIYVFFLCRLRTDPRTMNVSVRKISISSELGRTFFLKVDWAEDLGKGFTVVLYDGGSAWEGNGRCAEAMPQIWVWRVLELRHLESPLGLLKGPAMNADNMCSVDLIGKQKMQGVL